MGATGIRWRRVFVGAVVVVLVGGAFALGRATAPDTASPTTFPCTDQRYGIAAPAPFIGPDGSAYFSRCDMERARNVPFGDETRSINIYADRTSTVAIAWFYPDCGMPKGFVAVKDKRPDTCTTTVTTGTAPP